jgi:hypothetical protein
MKAMKRMLFTTLSLSALTAAAWAQTQVASNADASAKPNSVTTTPVPQPVITAADVQALKDALAAQQKQIQALQEQLNRRDQALPPVPSTAADAATKLEAPKPATPPQQLAMAAASAPAGSAPAVGAVPASGVVGQDAQSSGQADQQIYNKDMEGPLTIHFKGINITPGGFAAAEFVRRSRALGADLTTPFNNLTMPGASQNNLSEFFASARQSRPTVFIASRMGKVDFSAYVSGDFLSAGVTSTATQTNSYTLRLRQAWGQAKLPGGWSILGGQMWSLVTENKAGIQPSDDTGRTNDARPMTIDPQYSVGFLFARQPGIRLTKNFGDKVALAFAVENPQATVTTSGNTNNYLLVQQGANNSYNSTSTYGFNPSPDLIAKIAFDPGFGHYEIFGVADRFQDRVFPCEQFTSTTTAGVVTYTNVSPACPSLANAGTATAAYNSSVSAGGFGANARWTFFDKHIVFGLHGFGGSAVGRYGAAQLPDVSINADGTVHPIRNLQGLATLEWHGKKLDIYSYVGSEYDARSYSYDAVQSLVSANPVFVGYGSPTFNDSGCYTETVPGTTTLVTGPVAGSLAKCSSQTRDVTEGTIGFWYRFHNGPRGRYQWGVQYSYLNRATWADEIHGLEPHGLDSMVFTSFRYYLP